MPIPLLLAPLLTTLAQQGLGMLGGAILAKGKEVVEEKIGVKIPDDPAGITPELVERLKVRQIEHAEFLTTAALEETKAYLADTQDARGREVKISTSAEAPYLNKIIVPCLAIGILLASFVLFGVLMFDEGRIDSSRKDILIYILGVLSAICTQVVAYFFGSSAGSTAKDQTIKRALGGTQ